MNHIEALVTRYTELKCLQHDIGRAVDEIVSTYQDGNKVLVCGNGGSAADSEHIVGELMKGFLLRRPLSEEKTTLIKKKFPLEADYLVANLQEPLCAISLASHTSLMTAYMNDVAADMVFAQQVLGYGNPGDVLIAISTSGNSSNILNAVKVGASLGLKTIGMTNKEGGRLKGLCDILLNPPAIETFITQEYHLAIYHAICAEIERKIFIK